MTTRRFVLFAAVAACVLTFCSVQQAAAGQPRLGFDGTLVNLPRAFRQDAPKANGRTVRGVRINWVKRGSPAARMGLERGDIIVTIDNVAFSTWDGYYAALRMASQQPRIVLINVRNGRPTSKGCRLPHSVDNRWQPFGNNWHPDTAGWAIDLVEDMRRY